MPRCSYATGRYIGTMMAQWLARYKVNMYFTTCCLAIAGSSGKFGLVPTEKSQGMRLK